MHKINIKPLTVNKAYTGNRFKTKAYKEYLKALGWLLPKSIDIYPVMELQIVWGVNNPAADVDNPAKCFIDALQAKYGFNDKHIYRLVMEKEVSDKPFILFKILPYKKNG